jgi:DNA-binding transcriptional ArsR family regulator
MMTKTTCPHCGHSFDTDDPRARHLSPATVYVWAHAPGAFRRGVPMGPSELAAHVHLDPSTVLYHLRRLIGAGMVARIPESFETDPPQRHVYAGVPRRN